MPAAIDADHHLVRAATPAGTHAYFFNLFDGAGCVTSSQHVTMP